MVVIGVVTSIAALSFGNLGAGVGEKALERLRLDVQLLSNEAIIRSDVLALAFHREGYAFLRLDADTERWQLIKKDTFLKPRKFIEPMTVNLSVGGSAVALGAAFVDDDAGEGVDDTLLLEPQVISLPTGEVTPFTYQLENVREGYRDELKFDVLGRVIKETANDAIAQEANPV